MTVLVTGGRGLVGSHVIEALREAGEDVRAFDGDVTDPGAWRRASGGVHGIVHAAARVAQRLPYAEFERVNVGGTRLAVETARATGARLIHVSSVTVFGRTAPYAAGAGAVDEDFPFGPIPEHDFYARTKRMASAGFAATRRILAWEALLTRATHSALSPLDATAATTSGSTRSVP